MTIKEMKQLKSLLKQFCLLSGTIDDAPEYCQDTLENIEETIKYYSN